MKRVLKWTGITLLFLIVIMMIYSIFGLKQTLSLDIESIDLEKIPDGAYVGEYDCYRWSNKVRVTVKEHLIIDIKPLKIQQGREGLAKTLTQRIIDQQDIGVDAVSGATASSNGYLKAVESAFQ